MSKTTANGKPRRDRGEIMDEMPPNALDSERALLSGVLYVGNIDPDISIPAHEFYDVRNQAIWETLVNLNGEGLRIDEAAYLSGLKKHRRWGLDGLDSAYAIGDIGQAHGGVDRQQWHAQQIHAAYVKRTVSHHAEFLLQKARTTCELSELAESINTLAEFVPINGEDKSNSSGEAISIRADTVKPRKIRWLFEDQIPLAKYSTVFGHAGLGKSLLMCDFAARVSRGLPGPGSHETSEPGDVVMVQAEDDPEDTTVPRLIAAGADLTRIHFLTAVSAPGPNGIRPFTLEDVWAMERLIEKLPRPKLFTIDPVGAYCGRVDAHKDAEVRSLLMPVCAMAQRREIAIIGVAHFNKGNGKAVDRGMGSVAWIAAARMAWGVVKDTEEPANRLFLPIKCNLAKDGVGLSYKIVDGDGAPQIAWSDAPETRTMDDILSAQQASRRSPKSDEAAEWLRAMLADGAVAASVVQQQAKAAGHGERALKNAKGSLKVRSFIEGFGKDGIWYWQLPERTE